MLDIVQTWAFTWNVEQREVVIVCLASICPYMVREVSGFPHHGVHTNVHFNFGDKVNLTRGTEYI